MKVAFVAGTVEAEAVTKLIGAFACIYALKERRTVFLMQNPRNGQKGGIRLDSIFCGQDHKDALNEELAACTLSGMEYLIQRYKEKRLTERELKISVHRALGNRLYYLSAGEPSLQQADKEQKMDCFCTVAELAGHMADLVLIDAGEYPNLADCADLTVVLLSQDIKKLDDYFSQKHRWEADLYLVCGYDDSSFSNCRNMERIYRVERGKLLPILPSHPFEEACRRGKLKAFMERCLLLERCSFSRDFIKNLEQTVACLEKAMEAL